MLLLSVALQLKLGTQSGMGGDSNRYVWKNCYGNNQYTEPEGTAFKHWLIPVTAALKT